MPRPGGSGNAAAPAIPTPPSSTPADKVVKPKNASDVWYFRLPNALREKVGGAGIKGPLQLPRCSWRKPIDPAALGTRLRRLGAKNYLPKLSKVTEAAMLNPNNRRNHFQEVDIAARAAPSAVR